MESVERVERVRTGKTLAFKYIFFDFERQI